MSNWCVCVQYTKYLINFYFIEEALKVTITYSVRHYGMIYTDSKKVDGNKNRITVGTITKQICQKDPMDILQKFTPSKLQLLEYCSLCDD